MRIITITLFLLSSNSFAMNLNDFDLYGKLALLSSIDIDNGSQSLGDNSSRIGIKYEQLEIAEGWDTGLHAE